MWQEIKRKDNILVNKMGDEERRPNQKANHYISHHVKLKMSIG